MTFSEKLLQAALYYREKLNFSVIPIRRGEKKACIKWAEYQERLPTVEEIKDWWGTRYRGAGIGIVTGKVSGVTVLDADTPEAKKNVEDHFPDSYITPIVQTAKGFHYYFRYDSDLQTGAGRAPGLDIRNDGGYAIAPPSLNGSNNPYAWVIDIKDVSLNSIILSLKHNIYAISSYKGEGESQQVTKITTSHISFREPGRDETLFHLANHLVKSNMPVGNISEYLRFFAAHCDPPFPENEAETKIQSALNRADKQNRNIMAEVRDWAIVTSGHFVVTDMHKDLELVTKSHKHAGVVALRRLEQEGVVEKYGEKRGCYRTIEKDCPKMDWENAPTEPIDLNWVFGFEQYYRTMPKTICVIAGSQDAGKTAICLNMAILNHAKRVRYLSSEMDAIELRQRLGLIEDLNIKHLKDIDFRARRRNFSDVIDPDAINIIDYLRITDQFWRVADELEMICDRLKKGTAIIALQKEKGKELGRGASFSLELPRLYLTVDPAYPGNILRVVKCKNWADPDINPNGFYMKFKLVRGINLVPQGMWMPE